MYLTTDNIKQLSTQTLETCAAHLVQRQFGMNPQRQIYQVISLILDAIREEIAKRELDAIPIELALISMEVPFTKHCDTIFLTV